MLHLFATACFPPLIYIKQAFQCKHICLDASSHFTKQSLRNRYHIDSPNGIQTLIIPLQHNDLSHTSSHKVQISDDELWKKKHWQAWVSSYSKSPYFEYLRDELNALLFSKEKNLIQYNNNFLWWLSDFLKVDLSIDYTYEYIEQHESDYRYLSDSKLPVAFGCSYPQVFEYKSGFKDGLSCLDLICNVGKDAVSIISKY